MYGYEKKTGMDFSKSVEKAKEELKKEGFGVLTEIDVKKTLKEKLNIDHDNYVILGACNPSYAYKALKTEKEIGLVLPCNLIVYEDNGIKVSAVLPTRVIVSENLKIRQIAEEVEAKLRKVVDRI